MLYPKTSGTWCTFWSWPPLLLSKNSSSRPGRRHRTNGQSLTAGHHGGPVQTYEPNPRHRPRTPHSARAGWGGKDQLNAALKPHGLFFAPELSTSNRATLGGMINTDASGQGSVLYGKTRDHVLSLSTVLLGGQVWQSGRLKMLNLIACARAPTGWGRFTNCCAI